MVLRGALIGLEGVWRCAERTPGLELTSSCTVHIREDAGIILRARYGPTGDVVLNFGGEVRIDGFVESVAERNRQSPGSITIASCCGDVVTGERSRIETSGKGSGGDINILSCCTDEGGDIELHGLVRTFHKHGEAPTIRLVAFGVP